MKRPPSDVRRLGLAFTLLEMLVSVTILTLLIATVSQVSNSTMVVTNNSSRRMQADSQARLIFDCMANDFAHILKRKDVDYYFNKQTGNDAAFFFSEAPGFYTSGSASSQSGITLVGYRINSSYQLERLGKGLSWTSNASSGTPNSIKYLTYSGGSASPDASSTLAGCWASTVAPASSDPDYHVLGDQVYRFEFMFLLKDGTLSNTPWMTSLNHTSIQGLQDVAAIVVAIGILDSSSRRLVSDFSPMVGALPDAADGTPIDQTWGKSSYLTSSGIPKIAAAQMRIYQRYFFLK